MPHTKRYTYVPAYGDSYMYVYYPRVGWNWMVAPWVYGWGPQPYWGAWGLSQFAWYSRPWFRPVGSGFLRGGFRYAFGRPHLIGGGFRGGGFYGGGFRGGGFHGGHQGGGHGHR